MRQKGKGVEFSGRGTNSRSIKARRKRRESVRGAGYERVALRCNNSPDKFQLRRN